MRVGRMSETNNNNINAESKGTDSNKSYSKDKESKKLDSNCDEIVYEIRNNPSWWDYFVLFVMLFFGIVMVDVTKDFLFDKIDVASFVILLILGISFIIMSLYYSFYARKNRIYITNQGIYFEYRNYFRMQKRFFKFGEVGVAIAVANTVLCPITPPKFITIFPIGNLKKKYFFHWQLKPYCIVRLMAWNVYISPKLYDKITERCYLHEFLVKKTKETLESKGIDTKTLPYDLQKQFDI